MKQKSVLIYQCISTALICAYFLPLAFYYHQPDIALSEFRAHLSSNRAAHIVIYLSVIVILYSVIKVAFFRKKVTDWQLAIDTALLAFIASNVCLSVLCYSKNTEGNYIVSEHIVVPDSISGYRYLNGNHRQVYVYDNKKVFDVTFKANNEGYVSSIDYVKKKSKSGKRWIVLGDSFTSENYNPTNWVNTINQQLAADSLSQNELYSFSLEGIGIGTWHSIFFKDVWPNYEFDGLILAVYSEDVFREPIVLYETPSGVNCAYIDSITGKINPKTTGQELGGYEIARKAPWSKIDSLVASGYKNSWELSLLYPALVDRHLIPSLAKLVNLWRENFPVKNSSAVSTELVWQQLESVSGGKNGMQQFGEIIAACKKVGKPVIVCSVPDIYSAEINFASALNEENLVRAIAAHTQTEYFSGFTCFGFLNQQNATNYFHADGHWNAKGSAIFANSFYEFLKSKNFFSSADSSLIAK